MARRGDRARPLSADPVEPARPCDQPGCPNPGEHRAPRSRDRLDDYRWFCLDHVREYNRAWDYYRGMDPTRIEAHLREDSGWQRPTWPLGRLGSAPRLDAQAFHDPLGILRGAGDRPKAPPRDEAPAELRAALGVLDLAWPLETATLKARYKELAKRHHPDANGGDRASEEKLKDINQAYGLLIRRVAPAPLAAAG